MDVRIPETPPPSLSANLLPPLPLSADVFYEQPLRTASFRFCTQLYVYLYDVAYRNNKLYRSFTWNFFR